MTSLYRHYDENGVLLYVGIALNAIARLAAHRSNARWFIDIQRVEIQRFETREAALRAEAEAIAKERPKFNTAALRVQFNAPELLPPPELLPTKEIAALPSGYVGVYRAPDGRRWESYAMEDDLVLLGTFATRREAADARIRYWQNRARARRKSGSR